jgi:hypothetical protein
MTTRAKESAKRKHLNELIEAAAELKEVGPSIWQAAQDLLTAFEYKDKVLTSSAETALWTALRDLLQEFVDGTIGVSARIKSTLDDVRSELRGICADDNDNIDDLAREILNRMDHVLRQLTDAQRSAIKLRKQGFAVSGLTDLQFEIDALQTLKERFSNDWPWSASWNPPLDKEQAERSRAAYNRGECKSIDDLLSSLQ